MNDLQQSIVKSSINIFPVELFEEILQYCDPVDLSRYKSVCSTWKTMISRILEKETDKWRQKCLRDIPEEMQSSIFDPTFIRGSDVYQFDIVESISPNWIELWKSWIDWRNLLWMKPIFSFLEPLSKKSSSQDCITCITVLENIMALGSSEGYIGIFKINGIEVLGEIDAEEYVSDIKLSGTEDLVYCLMTSISGRTKLWTIKEKIVTVVHHCTPGDWFHEFLINELFSLALCPGRLYTFESTRITIWKTIFYEGRFLCGKIQLARLNVEEKQLATGVEDNAILAYSHDNRHIIIDFDEGAFYIYASKEPPEVPIQRYYIFKPRVTACIGVLGQFGFSVKFKEWKMYDLWPKYWVTAIVFHASTLALGLKSGEVHVFRVESVNDLQNLDLDGIECRRFDLHAGAIISLNVTEYDSSPVIIAADTRQVFIIKFVSP